MKARIFRTACDRFSTQIQRQNYYVKLLFSYLALIVFCVSGMSVVAYHILYTSEQNLLIKENDRILYQFQNTIDNLIFSKTDDIAVKILEDSTSSSALTRYFTESMDHHIYGMNDVMKYCTTIRALNPILRSVGIYYENNRLYISSDGVEAENYGSRTEGSLLEKCRRILAFSSESRYWCMMEEPVFSGNPAQPQTEYSVCLVRRIERFKGHDGALILALDENAISQSIRKTSPDSLDSILICDSVGTIISYSDKSYIGKNISSLNSRLADPGQCNDSIVSINGTPSLCSFCESASTGWKYVTFTSLAGLNQAGEKLLNSLLLIALCTLLAAALLSLVPSSLLAAPVRALEALCSRMNRRNKAEEVLPALNLNTLPAEISNQMTRIKEITPLMQDMLLSDLLFSPDLNRQEMMDRMRLIEFEFLMPKFCVVSIQKADAEAGSSPKPDEKKLCQQARGFFEPNHVLLFEIPRYDACFILLNFEMDFPQLKTLLAAWAEQAGAEVRIGAGGCAEDLREISGSCRQAVCGLSYFFLFRDRNLIFSDDVQPLESGGKGPEPELLHQLEAALEAANSQKASAAAAQIARALQSGKNSLAAVRTTLQICCTYLAHAMQKMAVGNDSGVQELTARARDLQDFLRQYESAMQEFFALVESRRSDTNRLQVGRAEEYIQKNICNRNLSLQMVADYLLVSPSHLSKIFKIETGNTFIDYVIDLKLKESRRLLLGSSLSIEEISETMGYSTPQYFISRFKAAYGITPKQFRSSSPDSPFLRQEAGL